jgi:integrase
MPANTRRRFTDKGIERLTAPPSGRIELWDLECPGFGLRLTAGGVKAFQVMFRVKGQGQLRRLTLGRYRPADKVAAQPANRSVDLSVGAYLSLAQARTKARQIISDARAGVDPEEAERAASAARAEARANTFAAVRSQFIEMYAKPKNRSWPQAQRYLERDLADWDARPIGSITRRDVIAAVDAKARIAAISANRLLAHTRKLFRWAASRDLITASPVINVVGPGTEVERERVLTESEIQRLWTAWDKLGFPFGQMLKLMLVTGQRRSEVASMRWADIRPRPIDTAASNSFVPIEWVWTLSSEQTKAGRSHETALSDLAMEIVSTLPRFTSGYLFPARGEGDHHASGFSRAKRRSDELSGLADWRL